MHKYDEFKQKNALNILRALKAFPENEGKLIIEALGEISVMEESYRPFFRELTDKLIERGYKVESTGDVGVILFMTLMSPKMRSFFMWCKETFSTTTMEISLYCSEEERKEKATELGRTIARKFYLTLGDIFGIEFVLNKHTVLLDEMRARHFFEWAQGFYVRVAFVLGLNHFSE